MRKQGVVFDVTGNKSYAPGGAYHGLLPSVILVLHLGLISYHYCSIRW